MTQIHLHHQTKNGLPSPIAPLYISRPPSFDQSTYLFIHLSPQAMTVLQDCPGLTVQIISNGAPLEEFEVNDADDLPPKTAVNHVQVEQDAEFEVHWQFDPDFKARHGLLASILLHGAKVYSKIVRLKEYREARVHSATGARSKVRGRRYNQPFEFAKIVVGKRMYDLDEKWMLVTIFAEADSGRALDQRLRDALSSAGQIEVQFRFIKNLKSKRGKADETFKRVGLTGPVPEKALGANALSHTGRYDLIPVYVTSISATNNRKPWSSIDDYTSPENV